jgi:hypothetical protein
MIYIYMSHAKYEHIWRSRFGDINWGGGGGGVCTRYSVFIMWLGWGAFYTPLDIWRTEIKVINV